MSTEAAVSLSKRAERARAELLRELEAGRFAAADRLPGERELAGLLGVSRTTLRKALSTLVQEGHLEQRQGFGTFVNREKHEGSVAAREPVTSRGSNTPGAELQGQGEVHTWVDETIGSFLPNAEEMLMLDLALGQPVWRWSRIGCDPTNRALVHETITFGQRPSQASVVTFRPEIDMPDVHRRVRRIRTAILPAATAQMLGCGENTIGLFIEERGFSADGRCAVLTRLCRSLDGFDITVSIGTVLPKASGRS